MNGSAQIKFWVIGVASLFLLIVAILLDLQYLYLMAASLAVLPGASFLLARHFATRFLVRREHAATAQEGRLLPVSLTVRSEGGLPQACLRITDAVPRELVPEAEPFDDAVPLPPPEGDPAEAAPADGDAGVAGTMALSLDWWDGKTGRRTYRVEPTKRGVYHLGPARVITSDPLGLFTFSVAPDAPTEIVVHPTPVPANDSAIGGEGMFGVRERDGKTRRGDGMDFHGVREYRPGDALRRVHWPTTARTGALAVVEFERAFQRDVVIGLDTTRGTEHGTGRETTLEYAVKAAATLADRTLRAGGGVTLVTQDGRVSVRPRDVDPAAARFRLFDLLARVRAASDTSLADALRAARPEGGTYFAILTSWGDPRLTAYLTERVQRGDSARVYFFEPASFGGPAVSSPAVAGGDLRVVQRQHSPWDEGGKALEYLLRDGDR